MNDNSKTILNNPFSFGSQFSSNNMLFFVNSKMKERSLFELYDLMLKQKAGIVSTDDVVVAYRKISSLKDNIFQFASLRAKQDLSKYCLNSDSNELKSHIKIGLENVNNHLSRAICEFEKEFKKVFFYTPFAVDASEIFFEIDAVWGNMDLWRYFSSAKTVSLRKLRKHLDFLTETLPVQLETNWNSTKQLYSVSVIYNEEIFSVERVLRLVVDATYYDNLIDDRVGEFGKCILKFIDLIMGEKVCLGKMNLRANQ